MKISAGTILTFGLVGKAAKVGTRHARILKSQRCSENEAELVICCRDKQIQREKCKQRGCNNEESSQFVIHVWLEMQYPRVL